MRLYFWALQKKKKMFKLPSSARGGIYMEYLHGGGDDVRIQVYTVM